VYVKKVGFFLKEFVQGVGYAPFETGKADWAYFEIKGNTEGLMNVTLYTADDSEEEPPEKMDLSLGEARMLRDLLSMVCAIDDVAKGDQ
jgi:hypothetical protein